MDGEIDSFKVKREIVTELKKIEDVLKMSEVLEGWIGYTKINNAHIIRMYAKLGAVPFRVDIQDDNLWFKKECN